MRQDGGSLSSKLLSLIGSASAILKRKSSSHSSFTPVDAMNPSPMFATNPADESIDLEIGQELGKAPTAVDYDRYDGEVLELASLIKMRNVCSFAFTAWDKSLKPPLKKRTL